MGHYSIRKKVRVRRAKKAASANVNNYCYKNAKECRVSIDKWQYCDEDKKAIREGTKKPEDCTKKIFAAGGHTKLVWVHGRTIPKASDELIKEYQKVSEKKHTWNRTYPLIWKKTEEVEEKPANIPSRVYYLQKLAKHKMLKWDRRHPAPTLLPDNALTPEQKAQQDALFETHKKTRSDAFSKIVTFVMNIGKPKVIYRVLSYGTKDYTLGDKVTFFVDTYTNIDKAIKMYRKVVSKFRNHPDYDRSEITAFSKEKYPFGFKVIDYDQSTHSAELVPMTKQKKKAA